MRALLISLLAFSAAPVLAQEAPVTTAPVQAAPVQAAPADPNATPLVPAPPAADAPVSADQAVDPLADLIAQSGPQTTDEEDAAPQAPAPPHKPTILPIPGRDPDEIDPNHAIPQGGYVPMAEAYDLRVKGSILAAQGLQGPLDGGWSIEGPDGAALYRLQLVDKVGGYDGLEGAWRDVRRPGTVGSTGLIDFVDRSYGGFLARFSPRPGQLATLDLTPRGDGSWSGKLNENGAETLVTAHRVAQATLPPGYVPTGRGPVIWGAPRPAAPRVAAEAPAKTAACPTKGKKGKALKAAKAKCAAAAKKAGKGKATTAKGKKGAKGKAVTSKGKGSAKGKATSKSSTKKKKR
ncbi:hypothetical protein [Caulobacter sp. CCG-8]|uniref:hypothetical protein n=1 Tax=Caulobacter sp. CCG-8 TaxID=3127958 RepID=UPI00307F6511